MSNYIKGLIVSFDEPLHEDAAKVLSDAIAQMKRVCAVRPVEQKIEDTIVNMRVKADIRSKLFNFIGENF